MTTWFARVMVACALLWVGAVHAQNNFNIACIEGSPTGYMTCRLKPDGFTNWGYSSGYGIGPADYGSQYSSRDKAVQETLNYWIYSSPSVSDICELSYSVEEGEISDRDRFVQSRQPLYKTSILLLTHGWRGAKGCESVGTRRIPIYETRRITCNHDWSGVSGYWGTEIESAMCVNPIADTPPPCETCPKEALRGNPILVPTREKIEFALDMQLESPMPLEFRRMYRSHRARDKKLWFSGYFKDEGHHTLGDGWLHNHDIRLTIAGPESGASGEAHSGGSSGGPGIDTGGEEGFMVVRLHMNDGTFNYFHRKDAGTPFTSRNPLQKLTRNPGGSAWTLEDSETDIRYEFDSKGLLLRQVHRSGWSISYTHWNGLLTSATNNFGRRLEFAYNAEKKLIRTDSDNQGSVSYGYTSSGLLSTVHQVDGTSIEYLYTDKTASLPSLLAGIKDENNIRFSTYTYDAQGWALTTEKAGGVDRYEVPLRDGFRDPLNTWRGVSFQQYGNYLVYKGSNLAPLFPDELPQSTTTVVNAHGLTDYFADHEVMYTSFGWDTERRLPVRLTGGANAPVERHTYITWHPQWRLPLTITEPGKLTTYTYDSLGNPLTQAITDNGAGGTTRTTSWTYNTAGLVATETAPNSALTSYTYDTRGNLTQSTNALGHVDSYTYDVSGRVLTSTAPNGLLTTYTYDARGRVLTSNQGGKLTTITYRPSGQVATVALPHGHIITYTYDGAHRLVGWSDNRGNSGSYGLDGIGNRTTETIRNSLGQPVWQLARSISAMNRVEAVTAGTQATRYRINNNGDVWASSNDLGEQTNYLRDALRRIEHIDSPEGARTTITRNALDAVTKVSDFKGAVTDYTRDALGNAKTETSPDSGSQSTQYDALGLPSSITNALGQATTITRDLLGRPTSITHSGGTTTLRYDQSTTSKGYLSEIEDASGTTTYQRDLHGRVTSQTQRLINNDTRTLAYSYSATTGLLASTTYPGGQVLQNVYDATGQLTGLTWAGQPLVSGITWSPLGQPTAWSWNLPGGAAAIPATRSYNTAGQLTATEFSSYVYDAAGRITSLTQSLMQPASTDAQASTVTQAPATWTVTYNRAGRITGFTKTATDAVTYTYDANGNRLTSSQQRAGITTNRTYTVTGNRQTGFSQTQTGGSTANTSVTYGYNAAGDLLTDGLRTFQYDSEERLEKVTTGTGVDAPSTQYAHNALGQRVFKTEPLFASGSTSSGSGAGSTTSGKNLNNLLADPEDQEEAENKEKEQDKGLIQTAYEFFTRLWSPGSSDAQKLGFAYVYGNDGTLLGEYGMGGSNSTGTTQYIYLPTANGPMPIAAIVNGTAYAVHSDHLNTPRKLTQPDGQVAWQWAYSAFGDEQPTLGSKRFTDATTNPTTGSTSIPEVTFNLRYPGQYYDKESGLHYNYFRSYSAERGRYTQADPIGLGGGFNRFGYVNGNPLRFVDPKGLEWLIDPARRPPSVVGSNTIYCKDETPSIYVITKNACEPIVEGVRRHEKRHIADALSKKPNICSGNIGDVIIVNDNAEERLLAEENAQTEQINYLKEALKTCAEDCRIPINTNINTQEYILNQRIRRGNYP